MTVSRDDYIKRRALVESMNDEVMLLGQISAADQGAYSRLSFRVCFSVLESILYCLKFDLLDFLASSDMRYEKAALEIPGVSRLVGKRLNENGEVKEFNPSLDDTIKGIRELADELQRKGIISNSRMLEVIASRPANF